MNIRKLKIIILLCIFLLQTSFAENLNTTMITTNDFFNDLVKKYETTELTNKTKLLIEQEINYYLKVVLKQVLDLNFRKKFYTSNLQETDLEIFKDLKEILRVNITNIKDLYIVKILNQNAQLGIVLTSSQIMVYHFLNNALTPITSYPMENASKIRVINFFEKILIIVKKSQSIQIFNFFLQHKKQTIREIQRFNITHTKDVSVWQWKNQLFLGILTTFDIYVYIWLEENFDLIQIVPFRSEFINQLFLEQSIYFIISGQHGTAILEYRSQIRQFVTKQSFQKSFRDSAIIQLESTFSKEYFLVLSNNETTILYKNSKNNIFIPFQEIASADHIISTAKNNTALLLLVKDEIMYVYQYDGWRFVKLNFQISGIERLRPIIFNNEKQLLIKRIDNIWSINRIIWVTLNKSINSKQEITQWCLYSKRKIKQNFKSILKRKASIQILKDKIKKLKVNNVNKVNIRKLRNLTHQYNQLVSHLAVVNEFASSIMPKETFYFTNLRAQIIRVNCISQCNTKNLITKTCNTLLKVRKVDEEISDLRFKNVKIDKLSGFPCPLAGIKLNEVNVKGLINGISFKDMQNNVLKTLGNQVVIGEHKMRRLRVENLIVPNIDVAISQTRQNIMSTTIHAKDLYLTGGGLLLPLNGEPVMMSGGLTTSRAKFNGPIHLRGGLKGKSVKRFAPMVYFSDNWELNGDYAFENVRVMEFLSTDDIIRQEGKSIKNIVEKTIPLSADIPVRLALFNDRIRWTNLTIKNLPNWLIRRNSQMIKVTGKKITLKNVTLSNNLYSNLPIPKLQAYTCSIAALASNIKTSTIKISQGIAKFVFSENVFGAKELDKSMMNLVVSLDNTNLSKKSFTGITFAENVKISNLNNSPFRGFQKSIFKWHRPNYIERSIKMKNFKVESLTISQKVKIPFPVKISNIIVEGNLQVKTINGINLDDYINNIVQINDTISMKTVTFAGNLEVIKIESANTNIDIQNVKSNPYLGRKRIFGDLEIDNDFAIPHMDFYFPEITTYAVEGSIKFKKEPNVEYLNGMNLRKLISEIWMNNRPINLKGNFIMKNITLTQSLINSYKLLNIPKFGSWEFLESRFLSKTKLQEIRVSSHFKIARIPNVITQGNSTLHSSIQYLNDLMFMTLKKNENQTIQENWRFDELIIKDNLMLHGKINNLNLSLDVARYDVEVNKVIGVKILNELTVKNLNGMNFEEWTKDALMLSDIGKLIIIKGKKIFDKFNGRIVNVNGTVMGKTLKNCLLKIGDQIITARKVIKGSLFTPFLTVEKLINDINLTMFIHSKLEKNKLTQKIKSKVLFENDLQILGNLTVRGIFQDINLKKINALNITFSSAMGTIAYFKPFATGIKTITKHLAKYWNKFEYVKENISFFTVDPVSINDSLYLNKLGNCNLKNLSKVVCNEQNTYFLKSFSNLTGILINQLLLVENVPLVIQVSSGPRSRITIYAYDYVTNSFDVAISVRAPGITEVSVSILTDIVWITTRLKSQMLILRYETWGDFEKYHLPYSPFFILSRISLTNELILIREDGMWKLENLTGPKKSFKVALRADKIETFSVDMEFLIKLIYNNSSTKLLRAKYVSI